MNYFLKYNQFACDMVGDIVSGTLILAETDDEAIIIAKKILKVLDGTERSTRRKNSKENDSLFNLDTNIELSLND